MVFALVAIVYPVKNKKASDQTRLQKPGWADAVVLPIRR
ncbi:hypothetical protein BN2497_2035 [Janthinobacterium sp. CG23_2]|nr:hypothetical protein BN2497_2035 [Janthinobacterium sp. CG23_2]CUU27415.1 hypothetical protein BN3177_2035 [Janthinobacterium sp. CG23_2]